jgi:hypothetical protein
MKLEDVLDIECGKCGGAAFLVKLIDGRKGKFYRFKGANWVVKHLDLAVRGWEDFLAEVESLQCLSCKAFVYRRK